MGAWGTGLFSDDDACDIRDQYRELVGDGVPGPQATDRLLEDWAEALEDPDAGPVLWLALADTQWRLGRLEDRVRQQALDVIEAGRDLDRWESRADRRKRATVLEKLRVELNSPQRSPVKVRSPLRTATPLRRGDAAAYRLGDGRLVVLRVVGHVGDERDNYPIVEVADWIGHAPVPDPGTLGVRRPTQFGTPELISVIQHRKGDYPADRVTVLGRDPTVTRRHVDPSTMIAWPRLEGFLDRAFGLGTDGSGTSE